MDNSTCAFWTIAGVVFLSAFLLFQVQPLMGKAILPWFGGTPAVWSTCLLFFQVVLFLGYAYAHWVSQRRAATQLLIHAVAIGLAIRYLPILPSADWKPAGDESPTWRILGLLTSCVGLPYFILSSTGPLLQTWFRYLHPQASPYRLYALSNAGSLLALLSYPFLVEPNLSMSAQAIIWSALFVLFTAGCLSVCFQIWQKNHNQSEVGYPFGNRIAGKDNIAIPSPRVGESGLWFALAATASSLLLAITNQVCQDVASVPFLWIVPLTIYLLTFILCFDADRWYRRTVFAWGAGISAGVVGIILVQGSYVPLLVQGGIYFTALFCCCMLCHGELAARKPDPKYLTSYFLTVSAGGAAGGVLVNLIAPLIFPAYWELHFSLVACVGLVLYICYHDQQSILFGGKRTAAWFCLGLASFWLTLMLGKDVATTMNRVSRITRGFFGVLRVLESSPSQPAGSAVSPTGSESVQNSISQRLMVHGRIVHGVQLMDGKLANSPTAYYGQSSGIGRLIRDKQAGARIRLGMIGLGVGTIATYGRAEDYFRFYEIDRNVIDVAASQFSFLSSSPATIDLVLGDGRLALEREAANEFDILVVDAFSGDAIPTHLLTREALRIYLKHLTSDGVLAIHYSNLHFDLEPVLSGLAIDSGLQIRRIRSGAEESRGIKEAHWAVLARGSEQLDTVLLKAAAEAMPPRTILWTDGFNNLFQVLKRR